MNILAIFIAALMFLTVADAVTSRVRASGHGGKALLLIVAIVAAAVAYANSVIP